MAWVVNWNCVLCGIEFNTPYGDWNLPPRVQTGSEKPKAFCKKCSVKLFNWIEKVKQK